MTLPAFRYSERAEERKKHAEPDELGPPYTFVMDVDDTITAAPAQFRRLAEAIKALGDHVVILTGHGPKHTRETLLAELGVPYDEIVIVDPKEDGAGKAKALKHLGAFFCFDDRVEFGPEIIEVCPVTFQYVEPPGDDKPKKDAKAAAKALKKS